MPKSVEDRLVLGDTTVVAELYRQHGAFVHTVSQELVGAAADRLTQQIFVEAWRDRLDFDPSMGTVRNWLVRRARDRVSKPSAEADAAVDHLVVGDSLNRMDDIRQRVLRAGVGASDIDELAAEMDLPVATVNGHLRRGMEVLKADLADSRADGSSAALADVLTDGIPDADLNEPPDVVWIAVVAELRLAGDAADLDHVSVEQSDDEPEPDSPEANTQADTETVDPEAAGEAGPADTETVGEAEAADTEAVEDEAVSSDGEQADDTVEHAEADSGAEQDEVDDVDGSEAEVRSDVDDEPDDIESSDHATSTPDSAEDDGSDTETLRADATSADLDRPIWQNPAVVILVLIVVAVLIALIF